MALVTQAERLKLVGDEAREQCVARLTGKIADGGPFIPALFRTDIIQELSRPD
jgi:hypothetical protein